MGPTTQRQGIVPRCSSHPCHRVHHVQHNLSGGSIGDYVGGSVLQSLVLNNIGSVNRNISVIRGLTPKRPRPKTLSLHTLVSSLTPSTVHKTIIPSKHPLANIKERRQSLVEANAQTVLLCASNDSPVPESSRQNLTLPLSVPNERRRDMAKAMLFCPC